MNAPTIEEVYAIEGKVLQRAERLRDRVIAVSTVENVV